MSTEGTSSQPSGAGQQRINEFMKILPLTLEISGLSRSEHGKYFNEGQMETRAATIRAAYKMARQILLELAK